MIKKLIKHGDGLAVPIDKPMFDLLNINEHTSFNIKTGTNIIIEPIRVESSSIISDNPKLQKLHEELVEKYDAVLKKLAKN